jgi:hypothetical protein
VIGLWLVLRRYCPPTRVVLGPHIECQVPNCRAGPPLPALLPAGLQLPLLSVVPASVLVELGRSAGYSAAKSRSAGQRKGRTLMGSNARPQSTSSHGTGGSCPVLAICLKGLEITQGWQKLPLAPTSLAAGDHVSCSGHGTSVHCDCVCMLLVLQTC